MEANVSHKPNKGGPEVLKSLFGQDKAQVANLKGKAHLEENKFSYPSGLGESLHSDQSMSGLSESSRLLMVAAASVVSMAPMGVKLPILSTNPLPGQVTELLASISVVSHPDREVERHFGDDSRITMEPQQPRLLEAVGLGSNSVMSTPEVMPLTSDYHQSLHRSQWEASNNFSNRFYPFSNLDKEVDPWSKRRRRRRKYLQRPIPRVSKRQTGLMLLGVEFVDGLQNGE